MFARDMGVGVVQPRDVARGMTKVVRSAEQTSLKSCMKLAPVQESRNLLEGNLLSSATPPAPRFTRSVVCLSLPFIDPKPKEVDRLLFRSSFDDWLFQNPNLNRG